MFYQNPAKLAIQKFLVEAMGELYFSHVPLIERLTHYLVTQDDVHAFAKLASDLHSIGYMKAASIYTKMLETNGIKIVTVEETKQKKGSDQKVRS